MHHRFPRRWRTWSIPVESFPADWPEDRFLGRLRTTAGTPSHTATVPNFDSQSDPLAELRNQPPGPDGIRQALVARVRQMIADGVYDTPDRWEQAEDQLFRHVEQSR